MAQTYWYCYDRSGSATPPYFETRDGAAEACDEGETPRAVSGDVIDPDETRIDSDDGDDSDPIGDAERSPTEERLQTRREAQIRRGGCPWCDEYDGEHVGRHASSAHTEKWNRFKNKRDA